MFRLYLFTFGDVFDDSLVVQQRTRCITNCANIFSCPDSGSILTIGFQLEPINDSFLFNQPLEKGTSFGVNIMLPLYVLAIVDKLVRRCITKNTSHGRICRNEFPIWS